MRKSGGRATALQRKSGPPRKAGPTQVRESQEPSQESLGHFFGKGARFGKRPLQRRESGGGFGCCVFLWEEPHDDEELEAHGNEAEDAAFGADGATG